MEGESASPLERRILLHLFEHRAAQVRFEADPWTTELGIARAFPGEDPNELKGALRWLENGRYVQRRVQYTIGYAEPKPVFALTPSGHHMAVEFYNAGREAEPKAEKAEEPGPDAEGGGGRPPAPPSPPVPDRA
jgi:hypothetical protein